MATSVVVDRMTETASDGQPRVEKVFVTPKMAGQWLCKNVINRKLINSHVKSLEQILLRGEWVLNGDTIRFGTDGALKDGQHRLTACVLSGVGFWSFVAYNLDEEAFDTIDTTSRPRATRDVLTIHSKLNATTLASAVKFLWVFRTRGQVYDGGADTQGFSPKMCLQILERRPSIEHWVGRAVASGRVFPSCGLLSALSYLFASVDLSMAEDLLAVMGEGSSDIDRPFNILRESLINRRMVSHRMRTRALAFMTIKAWNSELSADWLKKVYFKPTEDFPLINGLDYEKLDELI